MKSAVMITGERLRLYREEGYMFLEKAIPEADLGLLQQECTPWKK
jgi:hypothetical protein